MTSRDIKKIPKFVTNAIDSIQIEYLNRNGIEIYVKKTDRNEHWSWIGLEREGRGDLGYSAGLIVKFQEQSIIYYDDSINTDNINKNWLRRNKYVLIFNIIDDRENYIYEKGDIDKYTIKIVKSVRQRSLKRSRTRQHSKRSRTRQRKSVHKTCPPNKILNPKTGRCVKKTGRIGKKLSLTHRSSIRKSRRH